MYSNSWRLRYRFRNLRSFVRHFGVILGRYTQSLEGWSDCYRIMYCRRSLLEKSMKSYSISILFLSHSLISNLSSHHLIAIISSQSSHMPRPILLIRIPPLDPHIPLHAPVLSPFPTLHPPVLPIVPPKNHTISLLPPSPLSSLFFRRPLFPPSRWSILLIRMPSRPQPRSVIPLSHSFLKFCDLCPDGRYAPPVMGCRYSYDPPSILIPIRRSHSNVGECWAIWWCREERVFHS